MPYLKSLTREVKEMWALVLSQHQKSLTALTALDKDLAREIILIEERVNSCEQFIESDCENYFSLQGSSVNIPFVMFALKITRQLEIMGDLAKKIAGDILNIRSGYAQELLEKSNVSELFKKSNKIVELSLQAFDENDIPLARLIQNRIEITSEMISDTNNRLVSHLRFHPEQVNEALNLFSVIESIKRTVELSQNIAEGIINYNQLTPVQP